MRYEPSNQARAYMKTLNRPQILQRKSFYDLKVCIIWNINNSFLIVVVHQNPKRSLLLEGRRPLVKFFVMKWFFCNIWKASPTFLYFNPFQANVSITSRKQTIDLFSTLVEWFLLDGNISPNRVKFVKKCRTLSSFI